MNTLRAAECYSACSNTVYLGDWTALLANFKQKGTYDASETTKIFYGHCMLHLETNTKYGVKRITPLPPQNPLFLYHIFDSIQSLEWRLGR